jgi:hypothetical protein
MTSTITRPPKPYFLYIYIISRLGVSNGILCISSLNCRDDFMSWLAGCGIAGAETTVVVDEAGEGEVGGEIGGEDVEVPFFETGEAVGEDEAGVRAGFGGGGWIEPAAEGYSVSCFEGDILTGHDGSFEINFGEEDKREWSKIVEKWV